MTNLEFQRRLSELLTKAIRTQKITPESDIPFWIQTKVQNLAHEVGYDAEVKNESVPPSLKITVDLHPKK